MIELILVSIFLMLIIIYYLIECPEKRVIGYKPIYENEFILDYPPKNIGCPQDYSKPQSIETKKIEYIYCK
jgi:hypothetical protein